MKHKTVKKEQSEIKEIRVVAVAAILTVVLVLTVLLLTFCNMEINKLEIINTDVKIDENGEKYAVVYLDENGCADYKIEYKITPKNAQLNKVEFLYNKTTPGVAVDKNGLVSFTEVTAVEVTVRVEDQDNNSAEDKIFLIAKNKQ